MSKNNKDWTKFKEHHEDETKEASFEEEAAEEEAALEHPSYDELEQKLTQAEQKAHEHWEKEVRVRAELENLRQRMDRELSKAQKYASEPVIKALLPTLDSLEQALQIAEKHSDAALHEGLELTMKLFMDALGKLDVSSIDPLGQMFNPQEHEAMSTQESPEPPNTVLLVFQKGYKLNDRVIRPARVIVSK